MSNGPALLLTRRQAAARLSVSVRTFDRHIRPVLPEVAEALVRTNAPEALLQGRAS